MPTLLRGAARRLVPWRHALACGLGSLGAYRLRTGLAMLAVCVGIATVTGISAIISGWNREVTRQIRELGSAVIFMRPFAVDEPVTPENVSTRRAASWLEVQRLAAQCRALAAVTPLQPLLVASLRAGPHESLRTEIWGTDSSYESVHAAYIERGRFLSAVDVRKSSRVAVIGATVADTLFPRHSPLGREIWLDRAPFRVIGVLERRGELLGVDRDNLVLLPIGTLSGVDPAAHVLLVNAKALAPERLEAAMDEVRESLRRQRSLRYADADDFVVFGQEALEATYRRTTRTMQLVMLVVSSIALSVAGLGVMSIMLASVRERTYEIGLRKALGARRVDVVGQFLLEAVLITGAGGALGVLAGVLLALALGAFSPFPTRVHTGTVLLTLCMSLLVGVASGVWPAARAARLDPADALRHV